MVDQSIKKLYKRDHKVFIPDFGAIIQSEDADKHYFNQHLTFDDGKLVNEISKHDKIEEEEAREKLVAFIQHMQEELKDKNTYHIKGIGYFQYDDRSEIVINETEMNYENVEVPASEPVLEQNEPKSLPEAIVQEEEQVNEPKPEMQVEEESVEETISEDLIEETEPPFDVDDFEFTHRDDDNRVPSWIHNDEGIRENDERVSEYYRKKEALKNSKRNRYGMWIAVPLILIILAATYYFKFYDGQIDIKSWFGSETTTIAEAVDNEMGDAQSSMAQLTPNTAVEQSVPVETEESNTKINKSTTEEVAKTVATKSTDEIKTTSNEAVSTTSNNIVPGKYQVILGSFRLESNADGYVSSLRDKGHEVTKFRARNGYYLVGFENIQSRSKALTVLKEVRNNNIPEAWIATN